MKLAPHNIRSQIFLGFLALIILLFINLWVSYLFLQRQESYNEKKELVQEVEAEMLKLYNQQLFFIENNFLDSNLYTENSSYEPLILQQKAYTNLRTQLDKLLYEDVMDDEHLSKSISNLLNDVDSVQFIFSEIISLQIQKGLKNWGEIGKMRNYAHKLESENLISIEKLLTLRRNEKDYLLRKELKYHEAILKTQNKLNLEINSTSTREYLNKYVFHFAEIVKIDEQLGDFYTKGLKLRLLKNIDNATRDFEITIGQYKAKQKKIAASIKWQLIFSSFFITAIALITSFYVSKKISSPLKSLIKEVKTALKKDTGFFINSKNYESYKEIIDLVMAFNHLVNKINKQITEINKNSSQLLLQNEELTKVNKELDQFVYSASHDLRSPLTTIAGLVNLLKIEENDVNRQEYLDRIDTLTKRLDSFIIDILNLSRNARLDLEYEQIDVESLIHEVFDNYEHHDANVTIEKLLVIEKNTHSFYTDKSRLKVILNNLISNSLKYADKYEEKPFVKVIINIDNERAYIKIIDNGIGIREEYQGRIFDMFYRANDLIKGSGLGLYIVRESLTKLKGHINFESKLGKGTSFNLIIPNQSIQTKKIGASQLAQV